MEAADTDRMVIALDIDGTLYDDGSVAPEAVDAIRRCRDRGDLVLIVTGRRWETVADVVPEVLPLVELVVGEEGGVLVDVATGEVRLLAAALEPALLAALRGAGVPDLDIGHVVVGGPFSHFDAFASARDLVGSNRHLVVNKQSVALAPEGCNKASGLRAAIAARGAEGRPIIAIGDAANDLPMFAIADHPYGVANADHAVRLADIPLTRGRAGRGVAEALGHHRPT